MKSYMQEAVMAARPRRRRPGMSITFFLFASLALAGLQTVPAKADTLEAKYPLLSGGLLASAQLADLQEDIVLESGSIVVREKDLLSGLDEYDPKLRPQLEQNLFFVLEQETTKRMLISDARAAQGPDGATDVQELIGNHLKAIADKAEVTDAELQAFYEANKAAVGDTPFDQVKEPIRGMLLQQKKEALVKGYLRDLGKNRPIALNRLWVDRQQAKALDNPVDKARQSGKPSMIEFGATGCIPCDMMQPVLESLRKNYGAALNVEFVHVGEQKVLGARYGIRSIPVQVFFDAQGMEVFRHEGFFPEADIAPILEDMGLKHPG